MAAQIETTHQIGLELIQRNDLAPRTSLSVTFYPPLSLRRHGFCCWCVVSFSPPQDTVLTAFHAELFPNP